MTRNETILQYLTSVPAWYLATSVNDQPHVRPFSFAAEQDGKNLVLHSNHQRRVARACGQPQVRGNLLVAGPRLADSSRARRACRWRKRRHPPRGFRTPHFARRNLHRPGRPHSRVLQRRRYASLDLQPRRMEAAIRRSTFDTHERRGSLQLPASRLLRVAAPSTPQLAGPQYPSSHAANSFATARFRAVGSFHGSPLGFRTP